MEKRKVREGAWGREEFEYGGRHLHAKGIIKIEYLKGTEMLVSYAKQGVNPAIGINVSSERYTVISQIIPSNGSIYLLSRRKNQKKKQTKKKPFQISRACYSLKTRRRFKRLICLFIYLFLPQPHHPSVKRNFIVTEVSSTNA